MPKDSAVLLVILLSASASFGLGYLAGEDAGQGGPVSLSASLPTKSTSKQFVASRTGKKFYLSWCGGASRISNANKIWFSSEKEAITQGYSPATNCKGL